MSFYKNCPFCYFYQNPYTNFSCELFCICSQNISAIIRQRRHCKNKISAFIALQHLHYVLSSCIVLVLFASLAQSKNPHPSCPYKIKFSFLLSVIIIYSLCKFVTYLIVLTTLFEFGQHQIYAYNVFNKHGPSPHRHVGTFIKAINPATLEVHLY